MGILLSFAFVLMRERADRTLQEPGDLQFWTHLPELGTIPSASIDSKKRIYGRRFTPKVIDATTASKLLEAKPSESLGLVTWGQTPSLLAEAFRTVLTSILFVGEDGSRPQVLVFTSANAGDGKTTVVSNLGAAMAEIGRKVLIIDADLRRPRIHTIFGMENEAGLGDILKQKGFNGKAVEGLVQESKIPGLAVLTSGPATYAAANLLYSANLERLLTKFREEYDTILIDTPPMLQMTDARVIGRLGDGIILVARAEQTTRDAMIAANQRFSEDRIRVLGTILNGWDPKRSTHTEYGGYYKYYGSSTERTRSEAC